MPNLSRRHLRASPLVALLLLLVASFSAVVTARAQAPEAARANKAAPYRISYALSMPQPALHLFAVSITVEPTARAEWVELQMPRWSPGRYAVFDFAKNVQEVSAHNTCAPGVKCESVKLPVTRVDDQTWRVNTHDWPHPFTFSYKVFGDDLSGTFSQLDARHANFNGGSIFMYVVSHKPDPVTLTIDPPDGWRIINARTTHDGQRVWQFPNYDILIDMPTEIAPDWTADEFKVDGKTYRVVVHSFGDEGGKRAAFVRDVEKIVRAETAMWGVPDFDSYTFLFHFDPTAARGDGMEHLTSTEIITRRALGDASAYEDTLDTAAEKHAGLRILK